MSVYRHRQEMGMYGAVLHLEYLSAYKQQAAFYA